MHKIIFQIPFNDSNYHGENVKKDWIKYRMKISMDYTINNLKKQTNQNFLAIFRCDEDTDEIIENELINYEPLPNNIKFLKAKDQNAFVYHEIKNDAYNDLFLVRLDSDDMYKKDYVEKLHQYKPKKETKFLINQKGYIYDAINHQLAIWEQPSPPFFVWIYDIDDYIKGKRTITPGGHKGAITHPHEILDENNFMVVSHHKNTWTNFKRDPYIKKIISKQEEANKIMEAFL